MSKFKKCDYFDPEGIMECEAVNCKNCTLRIEKEKAKAKYSAKWLLMSTSVISVYGIILYIIELIIRGVL